MFALVGGIVDDDWAPVHDFAERFRVPVILPQTPLPAHGRPERRLLHAVLLARRDPGGGHPRRTPVAGGRSPQVLQVSRCGTPGQAAASRVEATAAGRRPHERPGASRPRLPSRAGCLGRPLPGGRGAGALAGRGDAASAPADAARLGGQRSTSRRPCSARAAAAAGGPGRPDACCCTRSCPPRTSSGTPGGALAWLKANGLAAARPGWPSTRSLPPLLVAEALSHPQALVSREYFLERIEAMAARPRTGPPTPRPCSAPSAGSAPPAATFCRSRPPRTPPIERLENGPFHARRVAGLRPAPAVPLGATWRAVASRFGGVAGASSGPRRRPTGTRPGAGRRRRSAPAERPGRERRSQGARAAARRRARPPRPGTYCGGRDRHRAEQGSPARPHPGGCPAGSREDRAGGRLPGGARHAAGGHPGPDRGRGRSHAHRRVRHLGLVAGRRHPSGQPPTLRPGEYELQAAVAQPGTGGKVLAALARSRLVIPDLWRGALAVSPLVLGDAVAAAPASTAGSPFAFGPTGLRPSAGDRFPQGGDLHVAFRVLQLDGAAQEKPDLQVEYVFYERTAAGRFFNKVKPQLLNAQTLGERFDAAVRRGQRRNEPPPRVLSLRRVPAHRAGHGQPHEADGFPGGAASWSCPRPSWGPRCAHARASAWTGRSPCFRSLVATCDTDHKCQPVFANPQGQPPEPTPKLVAPCLPSAPLANGTSAGGPPWRRPIS